jgi:ribose 5-phosphate isomerase B
MSRKLISEQNVIEAAKRGETTLAVGADAIITDAARDRAKQLGITLGKKKETPQRETTANVGASHASGIKETIAIGSDHGGFQMKEAIKVYIEGMGHKIIDLGTYSEETCDYPDYAYAVARMVSMGEASKGIMIDSVGIASAIVANKIPSIRAACCTDEFMAKSSREHNNANILTLGGKTLGIELAKSIVKAWIETSFGGGRHQKRIDKITDIEKRLKT